MTALEELRKVSKIDLDSLDLSVAKRYGPFVDCTSNQVIVWFELQKSDHKDLLKRCIEQALQWKDEFSTVSIQALAVEIATISLAMRIIPHTTGCIHIQANTLHSGSIAKIIEDSLRIKSLTKRLNPEFDTSRLCIKIPSTWEGLQACKALEGIHGVKTLATTLFGVPQAILAGKVGCHYVAPYVHSLGDVLGNVLHRDADAIAALNWTLSFIVATQSYYKRSAIRTNVLPAALMTAEECLTLAGADHMTLAPSRFDELSTQEIPKGSIKSAFTDNTHVDSSAAKEFDLLDSRIGVSASEDEERLWKAAMAECGGGGPLKRMDEAIAVFNGMQRKLEDMAAAML